jgi:4-amino-4-deoxy-L-arabinose transferase-like glycosyltransferase
LLAAAGGILFHDLGARVLTNNDEARFPMLARGILAGDDWLLPHLRGGLYLNKPALVAWLIALASWPRGAVTQTTAVIPSLLSALALVLVTAWTARRLFGGAAALVAGLVTLSMYGVYFLARVPLPDMTMAC